MITSIRGFYDWIDSLHVRDTYPHGDIGIATLATIVHSGVKISDAEAKRLLRFTISFRKEPPILLNPDTFIIDWTITILYQFGLFCFPKTWSPKKVATTIDSRGIILAITHNLWGNDTICLLLGCEDHQIRSIGHPGLYWTLITKGMQTHALESAYNVLYVHRR
jgi:hypothetical protein